jgi:hypothetical protein
MSLYSKSAVRKAKSLKSVKVEELKSLKVKGTNPKYETSVEAQCLTLNVQRPTLNAQRSMKKSADRGRGGG